MYQVVSSGRLTVRGCSVLQSSANGTGGAVLRLVYLVVPKVMVTVSDTSADIG